MPIDIDFVISNPTDVSGTTGARGGVCAELLRPADDVWPLPCRGAIRQEAPPTAPFEPADCCCCRCWVCTEIEGSVGHPVSPTIGAMLLRCCGTGFAPGASNDGRRCSDKRGREVCIRGKRSRGNPWSNSGPMSAGWPDENEGAELRPGALPERRPNTGLPTSVSAVLVTNWMSPTRGIAVCAAPACGSGAAPRR
eukprot:scaffold156362_cov30-Tisochrysis_lutea.AAC.1